MNDTAAPIEKLFVKAENYSLTTLKLLKLQTIDKTADVASSFFARLAVLMVVALFIFIVNIGLALWIGELLGKSYFGFFITGGFYAILALLLNAFRYQWIKYPVSNAIINQMLKEKVV